MNTDATGSTESLIPCLHSLLHSIRCIAHHEDRLCELLHELHHTKIAQVKFLVEIRDLLEDLPSYDFLDDLKAVRDILGQTQIAPKQPRRTRERPRTSRVGRIQSRVNRTPTATAARGGSTSRSTSRKTAAPKTRRKSSR
jgi:hypothetical protein